MPFFIPFATRVQIFRKVVEMDQFKRRGGFVDPDDWRFALLHQRDADMTKHRATVRRESVFEDAFDQFFQLNDGLKEPIQIRFIDKFGTEEEGTLTPCIPTTVNLVERRHALTDYRWAMLIRIYFRYRRRRYHQRVSDECYQRSVQYEGN